METIREVKWTPIVDDPVRLKRAADILEFIGDMNTEGQSHDLMYGNMGISIFHAYHYRMTGKESQLTKAHDLASRSVQALEGNNVHNVYFGKGVAGILWGINHLFEIGILSDDLEELLDSDFLEILKQSCLSNMEIGDYDYMLGALGPVLLFNDAHKLELVSPIIGQLLNIKKEVDREIFWVQSPSITNPGGGEVINVGLAHGIPGILKILSDVKDIDKRIPEVILMSFNWLKRNQLDPGISSCYFPFSFSQDYDPFPTPLRWCYGDLGIAIGLYLAGRNIGNSCMTEYALEIAHHCAERQVDPSKVDDAHLCHGTAGIAQIFGRFYNYTLDVRFKRASTFWFDETMKRFDASTRTGYMAWKGDEFKWVGFDGLLEGSSGIGLTLISAISDIEPKWDRCLLLS